MESMNLENYPGLAAEILILLSNFKFQATIALLAIAMYHFRNPSKRVYLVDFICYKAPESLRAPISAFIEHTERSGTFDSKGCRVSDQSPREIRRR